MPRLLERLVQFALALVPLGIGAGLARRELALERSHARLELARAAERLLALAPGGRELGAQRRELLLGVGRLPRARNLRGEPLDLLPQLALAQIGELAVDDVLEAGAQLQQLDLVDGDLALELARLLRIGPARDLLAAALGPAQALEIALALGELRLQPLDLDGEVVRQRRILEHGLRDLAPVALALDAALELVDAPLLALHGIAQLHRGGGLLGQPLTAVRVLEVGDGALAFFQYLQALVELHLQLVEDAVALLLDALLDGLVLDPAQGSAQAPASAGLCGLL